MLGSCFIVSQKNRLICLTKIVHERAVKTVEIRNKSVHSALYFVFRNVMKV